FAEAENDDRLKSDHGKPCIRANLALGVPDAPARRGQDQIPMHVAAAVVHPAESPFAAVGDGQALGAQFAPGGYRSVGVIKKLVVLIWFACEGFGGTGRVQRRVL